MRGENTGLNRLVVTLEFSCSGAARRVWPLAAAGPMQLSINFTAHCDRSVAIFANSLKNNKFNVMAWILLWG